MEWIKCSDRMPEENKRVIIFTTEYDEPDIAFLRMSCSFPHWDNDNEGYELDQVTHWMSLPKAPRDAE